MNQQTTNRDTGEAAATNAPANSATSTSTPDNQPTPLDAFEVLLITGMSGAGRSHAADCVEDMGWYVVDNLPPKLLIPLVDMMTTSGSGSESGVHKLAAVIDVRSSYFDELAAVLGLRSVTVLNPSGTDAQGRPWGLLRGGETDEQPLGEFLQTVKRALGSPGLRYVDGGKPVRRVAVGGGSCADGMHEALEAGCDTFVTADVRYNQFWDAHDLGLNLIDAGHFYTENPVTRVLADALAKAFPDISVKISETHTDCMKYA